MVRTKLNFLVIDLRESKTNRKKNCHRFTDLSLVYNKP